ncbi:GNAT family N-acetyltransferase [Dactylosporangium sp. NPDC051485]|uniref:GNAT family N-acetyltransferase n=1 Tax=Dactylosporangium sp. NPDC051485 TaxID=3154846 RepID=UPI0034130A6C
MTSYAIRPLTGADITTRSGELAQMYSIVYREPPYNEPEQQANTFSEQLAEQCGRPGFLFLAAEAPDGAFAGFAYGFTFPPGRWWRSASTEPERTRGHQKFAILEWVVLPQWRRQGVGSCLFACLLNGRTEPFGTLCSNPRSAARGIYRTWGWKQVGTTAPPNIAPMDVLIKAISAQAP